jgi:hypothetical protein
MVLNLNRLLCVHFDLPLQYGLFKEFKEQTKNKIQTLDELCMWIERGFRLPKEDRGPLL